MLIINLDSITNYAVNSPYLQRHCLHLEEFAASLAPFASGIHFPHRYNIFKDLAHCRVCRLWTGNCFGQSFAYLTISCFSCLRTWRRAKFDWHYIRTLQIQSYHRYLLEPIIWTFWRISATVHPLIFYHQGQSLISILVCLWYSHL